MKKILDWLRGHNKYTTYVTDVDCIIVLGDSISIMPKCYFTVLYRHLLDMNEERANVQEFGYPGIVGFDNQLVHTIHYSSIRYSLYRNEDKRQ